MLTARSRFVLVAPALAAALTVHLAAAPSSPLSAGALTPDVARYASAPDHYTGTPRSAATIAWLKAQLGRSGLRTGTQSFKYKRFVPTHVALTVDRAELPSSAVAPLLYSGTTSDDGVAAPLVDGTLGIDVSVRGKIVVISVGYVANATALGLDERVAAAEKAGAAGVVAVTDAPADYPRHEDVDARAGTGRLPVLLVGKRSGAAVIAAARRQAGARLVLTATTGTGCDSDVWGILPGRDRSRSIVVGTPASSFVPAASERGSGVAVWLALARHYAGLPRSKRPVSLIFVATTGHEIGFLGLPALMAARPAWFRRTDAYVHLGASLGAVQATELPDGSIVRTTAPDPSGALYVSENRRLDVSVPRAFAAAGAPLPVVPPHVRIVGEQAYAYHAGVPLVSFSGSSLFFHTDGDEPSVVDPGLLAREADGFRRVIDLVARIPAGRLRADNRTAAHFGAGMEPNPTISPTGGDPHGTDPEPVARCSAP